MEFIGEFDIGGLATEFGSEGGADATKALDLVDKMNGKTNGFALIGEGSADGLFDPPAGVGAEADIPLRIEAVDRFHQAEVSFGDEIEKGKTAVIVIGGKFHNEAEVGLDHEFASGGVTTADAFGEGEFFGAIEQGGFADALEVGLEGGREFDVGAGKLGFSGGCGFCIHTRLDRRECVTFGLISEGVDSSLGMGLGRAGQKEGHLTWRDSFLAWKE